MDTITLYRVCHPATKCGPWNPHSDAFHELSDEEQSLINLARDLTFDMSGSWGFGGVNSHPIVRDDIKGWSDEYVCAVTYLDRLRFWFTDEVCIDALFDAGYTIKAYEVLRSEVLYSKSGTQCGFRLEDVISETDLSLLPLVA